MSSILNQIVVFLEGMTVKELKEIIKDWPEVNSEGEPTEVWVGNANGTSNPVYSAASLNKHTLEDGTPTADFILE